MSVINTDNSSGIEMHSSGNELHGIAGKSNAKAKQGKVTLRQ